MDAASCGRGKRIRKAPNRLDPGDHTTMRSRSSPKLKSPKIKKADHSRKQKQKHGPGWWRQSESDSEKMALLKAMFANERAASAVVRRHLTAARRDNEDLTHNLRAANAKFAALQTQLEELIAINAQMRTTAETKQSMYASALPAEVEVRSAQYAHLGIPMHAKLAVLGVCCAHPVDPRQRLVIGRTDAVPIV